MRSPALLAPLLLGTFAAGLSVGRSTAHRAPEPRVFELRTYTTPPGQRPALERRFREHTLALFARHGMTSIGYWTPLDSAGGSTTLVYLLAHPSREAAARAWAAFGQDPEWQRVRAASEANGRIVERVESRFLVPTDFSPMR